jgi:protein-tyrosine phosphatase
MTEIVDGLFLGSSLNARDFEWLSSNHITHILNMAKELPMHFPDRFEYKKVPAMDEETCKICKYFPEIVEFIDQGLRQGRVLVHCMMGISRSATAIILYLMVRKDMSSSSARKFVKQKSSLVNPNRGFITQLVNYELLNLKRNKTPSSLILNYDLVRTKYRSPRIKPRLIDKDKSSGETAFATVVKAIIEDTVQATSKKTAKCVATVKSRPILQQFTDQDRSLRHQVNASPKNDVLHRSLGECRVEPEESKPSIQKISYSNFDRLLKNMLKKSLVPSPSRKFDELKLSPCKKDDREPSKSSNKKDDLTKAEIKKVSSTIKLTASEKIDFFKSRHTAEAVPRLTKQLSPPKKKLTLAPTLSSKTYFLQKEANFLKLHRPEIEFCSFRRTPKPVQPLGTEASQTIFRKTWVNYSEILNDDFKGKVTNLECKIKHGSTVHSQIENAAETGHEPGKLAISNRVAVCSPDKKQEISAQQQKRLNVKVETQKKGQNATGGKCIASTSPTRQLIRAIEKVHEHKG